MAKEKFLILILSLLVSMAFVCVRTANAQMETGTIKGSVIGNQGPSIGTKVSVLCYGDPLYEGIIYTDEKGGFSLSGVPIGRAFSVTAYNKRGQAIGKGSGTPLSEGETALVEIEPVSIITQHQ